VIRLLVIVLAVAVLAWLGVMERAVRLQASGAAAAQRGDVAAAEADFRAARLLNPDSLPDVRRAFLYEGSGRPADAARVLEGVLRREPDNLEAWGLLYVFTRERDPASARRALEARRRLDPLGAR
jgi:predicted Zn-dependent protease